MHGEIAGRNGPEALTWYKSVVHICYLSINRRMFRTESRPGASAYSYSSSSFGRMGGADGTSYNRTFTERVGPGGVRQ